MRHQKAILLMLAAVAIVGIPLLHIAIAMHCRVPLFWIFRPGESLFGPTALFWFDWTSIMARHLPATVSLWFVIASFRAEQARAVTLLLFALVFILLTQGLYLLHVWTVPPNPNSWFDFRGETVAIFSITPWTFAVVTGILGVMKKPVPTTGPCRIAEP